MNKAIVRVVCCALLLPASADAQSGPFDVLSRMFGSTAGSFESALQDALENNLSGARTRWESRDGAGEVWPVRTFKARDGRYCREYRVRTRGSTRGGKKGGYACRSATGFWTALG